MKRIIYLLSTIAAIFAFTACEDVPEPYVLNTTGEVDTQTLLNETFASSLGKFTNFTTDGDVSWVNSYSCATATGYNSSTKTNSDGVAYLVGPSVDLTDVDSAYVTYEYILRYNRNDAYQQLLIAPEFVPNANNVADQPWQVIFAKHIEGRDYTTFSTAQVDIPQQYMGQKVRIALYFKAETNSSTWEVKNLKVLQGVAGQSPDTPDNPQPTGDNTLPYTSASLKDGFTVKTEYGTPWSLGNNYAKATGYANNATPTTTPTITWLISPAINTTKAEGGDEPVLVDFDYVLRYVGDGTDVAAYHKVYASADYDGDVATATWTDLGFTAVESATKDWTFYAAPSITLPAEFVGKEKVVFAFRFECNEQNSTTWELKNFRVYQGNNDTPDTPDVPQPTGDNLLANGDFEVWSGGEPVYWVSTTTASTKGILSQSNDAHGGNYAVLVAGKTTANQRLAYKEITLKAGTYTMTFYTKAATSAGGSVRPGYVPVNDGKVGSYAYGDYVNNLTVDTWTEVSHSFTLTEQTEVNLVVMNPKSPGADVLIDDFQLTTSDGGIVGGNDNPTDDPTYDPNDTSIPYGILFTQSTAGWTIKNIDLGGLSYVWKQDTKYGMKASAYNKANYATEAMFVSPMFDIPEDGPVYMSMSHALNFLNGNPREDYVKVEVKSADGTIEELDIANWPAGTDYEFVDVNIMLNKYYGRTIQFIFHYKSTEQCAPTWEIDSFEIHH